MLNIMISIFLSQSSFASMSDVDLQVRELISNHLQVGWDEVHSLDFVSKDSNCSFIVEASALKSYCQVCFKSDSKGHKADSFWCE